MTRNAVILFSIVFVIGIGLLFGSFKLQDAHNAFLEDAEPVNVTISEIITNGEGEDATHYVYVDYTYEGVEYQHIPLWYNSDMYVGMQKNVFCNTKNPTKLEEKHSVEAITFRAFGIISVVISGIPLMVAVIKAVKNKKFKESHVLLMTNLDEIEVITKYSDSGECPVKFHCSYVDEMGKIHKFTSLEMWDAPFYRVGDKIKVYIEPNNYKKYIMDIENKR